MRFDPVAGSSIRTSTGPRWGASSAVKSRRTADSSPVDGASTYSGINTSRESYRTPRTIEPSPARRSDDAIDTGANPNPVLPCKCSTGSCPERPSSNTSPSRANDTIGESDTLCTHPPIAHTTNPAYAAPEQSREQPPQPYSPAQCQSGYRRHRSQDSAPPTAKPSATEHSSTPLPASLSD